MSDPATDGIHLSKKYYKDFLPTDMQWYVNEIDDDFTLYDLFRLVEHAQHMIPGLPATMGMLAFKLFWEQIQLDRGKDDDNSIKYLELYWCPSYETKTTNKIGKYTDQSKSNLPIDQTKNYWDAPQIAELSNLMGLHGVGFGCPSRDLDFHECGDDCPRTTGYAIEFTPLNDLAHLPIRVLPSVEFYPPYVECDREFHRTGFELKISPTLWCFITSIFWELTFAGSTPNAIENHKDEIMNDVREMQDNTEEMDDEDENSVFTD